MVVLHAFLALGAGFATMAVLITIVTVLLQKFTPDWADTSETPSPGYTFLNLGCTFVAAAAGGYVTAWIAEHNPLVHVLALAITALLLAALSALQQRGKLPVWYLLALVAITPIGAFVGGLVRMRAVGVL
jgi:quinol-cytochrome oxidoreductase complex cytochrome b subunit